MGILGTTVPFILAFTLIEYLLGFIPVAVLMSRIRGITIFPKGIRLPGVSNVARKLGNWYRVAVFAGDD